jgi:hypothetical protein
MSALAVRRPDAHARRALSFRRPAVSREALILLAGVLVFIAVSAWWCAHDNRVPDWDSGVHMGWSVLARNDLLHGQFAAPWVVYTSYPPLQHLVGALTLIVAGLHPDALLLGANVVFVPLLAFGCYGTAKLVAGRPAGLLAGLVALGTPMFVSEMRMYEPDPAQAAMVAVAVWALLASERWRRPGVSALAGALAGLALLTKETSVVFLAGPILVTALRGGLRARAGALRYACWLLLVAGPWYAFHLHDLAGTFGSIAELAPNPVQAPPRLSWANAGWYLWNLLNEQTLAVVGVSFLVGVVIAARRCRRPLRPDNLYPELLAGALVSYLGMTALTHKDPRYTLPGLVFVAVLGTTWIASLRGRRRRRLLTGGLLLNAAVLFTGMSLGLGGPVRVGLPGAPRNEVEPLQLTVYETTGWIRGGPARDGAVLDLLREIHARGVRDVAVDTGPNAIDFNFDGIRALALMTGLHITASDPAPTGSGAYLFVHRPGPGDPAPCQRLADGDGIYVAAGNVAGMRPAALGRLPAGVRLVCPSG